jgi:hypothetical protein
MEKREINKEGRISLGRPGGKKT